MSLSNEDSSYPPSGDAIPDPFSRVVPPIPNEHKRPNRNSSIHDSQEGPEDESNMYGNDAMGLTLGAELAEGDEPLIGFGIIDPDQPLTGEDLNDDDEGSTNSR